MKKFVLASIFVGLFLFTTSLTNAQEDGVKLVPKVSVTQTQRLQEKQKMLQELKAKAMESKDDKRASISAKLTERKKQIVESHWQKLLKRLQATIDRLDVLTQRIENRLVTIKENNPEKDTSEIDSQIKEAKSMLTEAKTKLSALQDVVDPAFDSDSPKDAFSVVRTKVGEIKVLLKKVHNILVHIIGDIKGLRVGQEDLDEITPTVKPTSTVTATPTLTLTPTVTLTVTPTPTI